MRGGWRAMLVALVALAPLAAAAFEAGSPEDTLSRYLSALKEARFTDAYDLVSKAMKGGKDREVWAKEQRAATAFADVKIFEFDVRRAKIEGDRAQVPNVLSSQDRFINQLGLTEYELYTLVREDGSWKVDQQVIVEPPDVPKWFPNQPKGSGASGEDPSH